MMMFDLDEDVYDEKNIEELELNCPWTITVPLEQVMTFK